MANKKYAQEVAGIIDGFYSKAAKEWLKNNGLREEARYYLLQMENAGNDKDFDDAKNSFKNNISRPFYERVIVPAGDEAIDGFFTENPWFDYAAAKSLGSYEDIKKNEKIQNSKYATRSVNDKGETVVNIPLLRVANDPSELNSLAQGLHVSPEELRDHILNEWDKKKKREWAEDEKAQKKEIIARRQNIANEYANSWYGTLIGAVAPETMETNLDAIRSGKDVDPSAENKAVITDALVGLGTVFSGSAGGLALKNPKTAAVLNKFINERVLRHPATQAVAGGAIDAGLEAFRQGVSSYYEFDPRTIAEVGTVSATMPSIVGGLVSPVAAIPGAGRITRPFMKRLRQMLPDPSEEEIVRNRKIYENAKRATEDAARSKDLLKKEKADELLDAARDFIEQSPLTKSASRITKDQVKRIVKNPERAERYFNPPSREDYVKAIKERRSRNKNVSDKAEEWLNRAKKQWSANYNKISTVPEPVTAWDKFGDNLVEFGSREETLRRRATGKKNEAPSENLQYIMENDPLTIQTWENGFVPHDNAMMELYKEWKEKYVEGK